jgi:hypothetical protein
VHWDDLDAIHWLNLCMMLGQLVVSRFDDKICTVSRRKMFRRLIGAKGFIIGVEVGRRVNYVVCIARIFEACVWFRSDAVANKNEGNGSPKLAASNHLHYVRHFYTLLPTSSRPFHCHAFPLYDMTAVFVS